MVYAVESLTGQLRDRVCFDLVGSHQQGVASNEAISRLTDYPYPLNADGDDLR